MRHVARVGIVLAVLFAGIVLPGSAAQACRCAVFEPEALAAEADAVFYGEIVDRTPTRPEGQNNSSDMTREAYTIDVEQVFKGEVYAEQSVLAGSNTSTCGIDLPASGTVLVYGTRATDGEGSGLRYATSLCSGTQMRDSVPAVLGEGDPPIAAKPALEGQLTVAPDEDGAGVNPVVVGGVAVLLLAGLGALGVVMWRRRPSGGAA
jgi:hypothetical protein